jgi:mersacidin/lichenicidin family type 2 lantibiotic
MDKKDIIRAWKDEDYREGLSQISIADLPENPAGLMELDANTLALVTGGLVKETNTCACVSTCVTCCCVSTCVTCCCNQ